MDRSLSSDGSADPMPVRQLPEQFMGSYRSLFVFLRSSPYSDGNRDAQTRRFSPVAVRDETRRQRSRHARRDLIVAAAADRVDFEFGSSGAPTALKRATSKQRNFRHSDGGARACRQAAAVSRRNMPWCGSAFAA
jgi:hypothetical protein